MICIQKNIQLGVFGGFLILSGSTYASSEKPHWSYEGHTGPSQWAHLDDAYSACGKGHEQSPIDLRWKQPQTNHSIEFHYEATRAKIVDNGHTIQINLEPGSKVSLNGSSYDLLQFHFHTQSEHTLSGKHLPLEAHFVHKNEKGQLAVVGVMFKVGKSNPWIEELWDHIPHQKNVESVMSEKTFHPEHLLPKKLTHYHYQGSLTTPPCSEGVNWNVLNTPLELSQKQLDTFQKLYSENNRPVQQVHMRRPANY